VSNSRGSGLLNILDGSNLLRMSTVAEIESAIERLQPSEVAQLAAWLNEYQQMVQASAEMFALYDREENSCKKPSEGNCG
jgi:hypothetical protein